MNSKIAIFGLFGLLLLLPGMALAGTTCAAATVVPSDGRVVDFDFVAAAGTNFYQFSVSPNRSYSVEVRQDYDDVNTDLSSGTGSITIFSDAACSTAVSGAVSTLGSDPALPANSFRDSFSTGATVSNPAYRIAVTSASGSTSGRYISVSVAETTLYSPSFTENGNYHTFYAFANTTAAPISGVLTLTTLGAGSVSYSENIGPIPPGGSIGSDTTTANFPAALQGHGGSARFTHNGPPGGIQALATTANFAVNFVNPVEFKPYREKH